MGYVHSDLSMIGSVFGSFKLTLALITGFGITHIVLLFSIRGMFTGKLILLCLSLCVSAAYGLNCGGLSVEAATPDMLVVVEMWGLVVFLSQKRLCVKQDSCAANFIA